VDVRKRFDFPGTSARKDMQISEPTVCPLCGKSIKPQDFGVYAYQDDQKHWYGAVFSLCKACYKPFVVHYDFGGPGNDGSPVVPKGTVLSIGPTGHTKRAFEPKLVEISPQFEKIYNQALAAENSGLDEIAGMGYRKALEFLIKDYLIYKKPEERATIEKMELGKCIANKVEQESLKTVASRCAWLGNDQTHYVKRFEEFDLEMLKKLVEACVYWIQMELLTDVAAQMERR